MRPVFWVLFLSLAGRWFASVKGRKEKETQRAVVCTASMLLAYFFSNDLTHRAEKSSQKTSFPFRERGARRRRVSPMESDGFVVEPRGGDVAGGGGRGWSVGRVSRQDATVTEQTRGAHEGRCARVRVFEDAKNKGKRGVISSIK